MKKALITFAIVLFSISAYSQTIMPVSADSLPKFTGKVTDLAYVQNVTNYYKGINFLKNPTFGFTIEQISYLGDLYYICYDKKYGWIVFAVFMPKYSMWHINSKFVHLLTFNK